MDKAKIAEWILSLAMEPAQAPSVVGDLLESGRSRSTAWFWCNVFQIFVACVWRDGKARPLFVLGLAVRGALVECAVELSILLAFTIGIVLPAAVYSSVVLHKGFTLSPSPEWYFYTVLVEATIATLLGPFYAGQWIARRSYGKDIAVYGALAALKPVIIFGISGLIAWIVSLVTPGVALPSGFLMWPLGQFLRLVPCLTGVALVRRRRQMGPSMAC